MVFVLNIGNTNIQYGIYSNGGFESIQSCPTSEFTTSIVPRSMPIACASVVPRIDKLIKPFEPLFVSDKIKLGVDLSCVDSSTIGADRLANAAALACGELPAICIDCGTALTFEVVDSNKRFIGGAIAPGRDMMRKALNNHTALLPKTELNDKIPEIGTTTVEAINVGVDRGLIGAVKEIVQSFPITACRLVAIGGDATFLCNNISNMRNGGEQFTMLGIVEIWKLNNQGK